LRPPSKRTGGKQKEKEGKGPLRVKKREPKKGKRLSEVAASQIRQLPPFMKRRGRKGGRGELRGGRNTKEHGKGENTLHILKI